MEELSFIQPFYKLAGACTAMYNPALAILAKVLMNTSIATIASWAQLGAAGRGVVGLQNPRSASGILRHHSSEIVCLLIIPLGRAREPEFIPGIPDVPT